MNSISSIGSFQNKWEVNKEIDLNQNQLDKTNSELMADQLNQKLKAEKRATKNQLGQSDFLKLLVTQLQFQDPLKPMENKEFIAQMAQFSALEVSTKMNTNIESLVSSSKANESYNFLGKRVHYMDHSTSEVKSGVVDSITNDNNNVILHIGNDKITAKEITKVEL